MFFGDEGQREEHDRPRARNVGTNEVERLLGRRGIREVSMPVYDPNRGRLNIRELYAILHVVFAEAEIMVHIHKKYYLGIA